MKTTHWLAIGFALGMLVALAPSCSSSTNGGCLPGCGGCCNTATGVCEPGNTANACGISGAACISCPSGQVCQQNGTCAKQTTGGGCNAQNCTGCCDSTGTCQTGDSTSACGSGGGACSACTSNQSCNAGSCQTNSGGCTTGCTDGTGACQPGTTNQVCGANGAACQTCNGGQQCQGGQCVTTCSPTSCPNGCCDSTGNCVQYGSQSTTSCGSGGQACGSCPSGSTACTNGACQGGAGCSPSNCSTCCTSSGSCVTAVSNSSCGNGGNACTACGSNQTCQSGSCQNQATTPALNIVSHLNTLPSPWVVTSTAQLPTDGGSQGHAGQLTLLQVPTTENQSPCPLPYTPTTCQNPPCQTYCDGFNAVDSSGKIAVADTFGFLGKNNCGGQLATFSTSGSISQFRAIWQDNYDANTKTDTWVLSIIDCADLGLDGGVSPCNNNGCTNFPPNTTDIAGLLKTPPAANSLVTVHGVVTARWASKTAFGFTIQDPQGSPPNAIAVHDPSDGGITTAEPVIGDYVTVTGTLVNPGSLYYEIEL